MRSGHLPHVRAGLWYNVTAQTELWDTCLLGSISNNTSEDVVVLSCSDETWYARCLDLTWSTWVTQNFSMISLVSLDFRELEGWSLSRLSTQVTQCTAAVCYHGNANVTRSWRNERLGATGSKSSRKMGGTFRVNFAWIEFHTDLVSEICFHSVLFTVTSWDFRTLLSVFL